MPQLNIHLTAEFAEALNRLVSRRGLPNKSVAVRKAVYDALERLEHQAAAADFSKWRGIAGKGVRTGRRFRSEDDLWR